MTYYIRFGLNLWLILIKEVYLKLPFKAFKWQFSHGRLYLLTPIEKFTSFIKKLYHLPKTIMDSYSDMKCWEIISCDNFDCLARSEPDTPCWDIVKRILAFHDIFNTCIDCLVYIIHEETSVLTKKDIMRIINKREDSDKFGMGYLDCILKKHLYG